MFYSALCQSGDSVLGQSFFSNFLSDDLRPGTISTFFVIWVTFQSYFTTLGCNEKIEKQLFSENDFQSYKFCKRQNELPSADLDEEADQPVKSQKTCLRNYYKKNLEKVKGLIIQGYINGCEAYENRKDQVACFQFV